MSELESSEGEQREVPEPNNALGELLQVVEGHIIGSGVLVINEERDDDDDEDEAFAHSVVLEFHTPGEYARALMDPRLAAVPAASPLVHGYVTFRFIPGVPSAPFGRWIERRYDPISCKASWVKCRIIDEGWVRGYANFSRLTPLQKLLERALHAAGLAAPTIEESEEEPVPERTSDQVPDDDPDWWPRAGE